MLPISKARIGLKQLRWNNSLLRRYALTPALLHLPYICQTKGKGRKSKRKKDNTDSDNDNDNDNVPNPFGLSEDALISKCTENWAAAQADRVRDSWTVWDQRGIFPATCRHGFILAVVDIVQSGEQYVHHVVRLATLLMILCSRSSKYPLTIVNKLIDTYGKNLLIAYDIGCSFNKTLQKSVIADKVANANVRCAIPSFHGWAHNRFCQINYHPLYIQGTGIEDYEICEKMFSFTNGAASVTRHATGYHRRQTLEVVFGQWDLYKFTNLCRYLSLNDLLIG